MTSPANYADQLVDTLVGAGYTHRFFVAGGNINVEHFNASRDECSGRALPLVTAGPGITYALTGIAGAWQGKPRITYPRRAGQGQRLEPALAHRAAKPGVAVVS